jgi:hypothetical protein
MTSGVQLAIAGASPVSNVLKILILWPLAAILMALTAVIARTAVAVIRSA